MFKGTELLERERELAELAVLVADAREGAGQLAVVQGPAGIGKTRLLAAGRAEAERAGTRVLAARGSELERTFAYGVVRQLFEPVLAAAIEVERAELLGGAAGQAAALLGHADPTLDPRGGRDASFAMLHGLFWLTANLCAQGPLLVAVDDLHWCDVPSLRFLIHLLPRLEGLPLVTLVALRPAEPGADQHLLTQIITDPTALLLRPAPLSQAGSTRLVRALLAGADQTAQADDVFCAACHAATGGNPLLIRELAGAAAAEGVAPNAAGAARLAQLGAGAIEQRVALRLARLGPAAAALCAAVAILGDGAESTRAAALAGLGFGEALETARQLAAIEILTPSGPTLPRPLVSDASSHLPGGLLGFVHPLVRAAVYEGLSPVERLDGHARAAQLLVEDGATAEKVAAHLLVVPPAGDVRVVATLRRAANEAFLRGSPEAALTYLERCLKEPPPPEQRAEVLVQLGAAAQLVDATKAAEHLRAALALTDRPERGAVTAQMLGHALFLAGRTDEAVEVWSQATRALGNQHTDLRWHIEAGFISVAMHDPALRAIVADRVTQLRDVCPGSAGRLPGADLGSRMLDCLIALRDAMAAAPADAVVARARRGLADGTLIEEANAVEAFFYGCWTLLAADQDDVLSLLDTSLARAQRHGSIPAFVAVKCLGAMARLWQGLVAEAEIDAREGLRAIQMAGLHAARPLAAAYLAEVLMEQGRLQEAETALDQASPAEDLPGSQFLLAARARLLMLQGRLQEGVETMLACGRQLTALDGHNPAFVGWRSAAALALLALGRPPQAWALAVEELDLARRWGAPRALGRALRVAGLVAGGEQCLALLHEAVDVLASSHARLERAKALVELGAALRRSGRPAESRQHLRLGVEQAQLCGATPLLERGQVELRASGARPRRLVLSGPAALTPSERRVAELAAAGRSNHEIARTLFITTTTVEAHLTRTYRKLGIDGRAGLPHTLPAAVGL